MNNFYFTPLTNGFLSCEGLPIRDGLYITEKPLNNGKPLFNVKPLYSRQFTLRWCTHYRGPTK